MNMSKRLVGETVLRYFLVDDGMLGAMTGYNLYGSCSIPAVEILLAGQKRFLTNGILDAALVEMWEHCAGLESPSWVLLTNQSEAFTTVAGTNVSDDVARKAVGEIFGVAPRRASERFVMVLNLDNVHRISAAVELTGTIKVVDSMDDSFEEMKEFVVARLRLFAAEVSRLQRETDSSMPVVDRWRVVYVGTPRQTDEYN
eukprot:TRINITY_DN16008_c0_g1_i1.p2 TRINITY_DN16008_c0_g1~~TRINITY_DN16008_c0_g1_i1.p2  ORF type:complete len:200 (+),score=59.38 TRINITY_DN16008_c0_g1_i1:595-1194(+)